MWYTIRSKKRAATQPELPWANTAEVFSSTPMEAEQAQAGMEAWRVFERTFTFSNIEFHDATMSSFQEEDPEENPPDELYQYLGNVDVGLRGAITSPSPLDDTLFFNRLALRGQKGKLFLRGCIEENDLIVTARKRIMKATSIAAFELMLTPAFEQLVTDLRAVNLDLGMVSYPRIGWENVPVAPGARPKTRPVYGTTLYERNVVAMRVVGTSPLQLKQH